MANLLLISLLGITVGEHFRHHIPGDDFAELQLLSGQYPPHQTTAVKRLVVAGPSNIIKLEKSFEMLALVHGRQDTACAGHHALAVHNLAVRGGRWARHRDPLGGGAGWRELGPALLLMEGRDPEGGLGGS
jgi:hypothetical protein